MTRNEMCKKIVLKWNEDDGYRKIEFTEYKNGEVLFKEIDKNSGEANIDTLCNNWYDVFHGCYLDEMADWYSSNGDDDEIFEDFTIKEMKFIVEEIKRNDLLYDMQHYIGETKDKKLKKLLSDAYDCIRKLEGLDD